MALLLGSKEARWTGTAVMEIEEGKFLKTWINSDSISALIQLGLLQDVVVGQFARQVARQSGHQRTGSGGGVVQSQYGVIIPIHTSFPRALRQKSCQYPPALHSWHPRTLWRRYRIPVRRGHQNREALALVYPSLCRQTRSIAPRRSFVFTEWKWTRGVHDGRLHLSER